MTTLLRQESQNRNPDLAGITIDTIVLRFKLDGLLSDDWLPRPILSRWREHRGRSRCTWALAHADLSQARLSARDLFGVNGKLIGGTLTLELSVSELLGRVKGTPANIYKGTPRECEGALFSFVRALEEAWELADFELWERAQVVRVDVCADVWSDDPAGAVAVVAGRSAMVAKRAAQEGWSFETAKGPHSMLIPRRAREQGRSLRSTEPTVIYDKGRQLGGKIGRDLVGLVRLESVTGNGRPARTPLTIPDVCSWDFWTSTLGERLLELGLPQGARLEQTTDIPTAIGRLVQEGVSPAQAALYALSTLTPGGLSNAVPARALRANRLQVESKTNLRLTPHKTAPGFSDDLWALITGAPPHDRGSLPTAKIARLVGERTCAVNGDVDLSYLDLVDVSGLSADHVDLVPVDETDDTIPTTTTVTDTSTVAPPLHVSTPIALGAPPQALGDRQHAPAGEGEGGGTGQGGQSEPVRVDRTALSPRRSKMPSTGAKPSVRGDLSAGGRCERNETRRQKLSQIHISTRDPKNAPDLSPGHPAGPSKPSGRPKGSGDTPQPDPTDAFLEAICNWSEST